MATTTLTIPITGYGTIIFNGQTTVFPPNGPTNLTSSTVTIGTTYQITYKPYDATTKFSRFDNPYGDITISPPTVNPTTGIATANVTVNSLPPGPPIAYPFVVVYVKMPFYAQVLGDGRIDVSSNNIADAGTTLTVSGYMGISYEFFEVDWATGIQHNLTALYTPPAGSSGYSFGSWMEAPGGNPTSNPIVFPATTNDDVTALGARTNITLTVEQTGSSGNSSTVSSPPGIATNNSTQTDTATFPYYTEITLTATPGPGYNFQQWENTTTQTNNPVIILFLQAPYSIKAFFGENPPPETDIAQPVARDYVPSQGERADAMHICQCPCACTSCSPAFTSALNRTRQIRALISGSCCQYIPVGIVLTDGGSGYAVGDILQLQGGTPLEKPALFKVLTVNAGTGEIDSLKIIYGQPYRMRPGDDVLVPYTGSGSGGDFAVLWSACLSPANLYRQ